MGILIEAKCRPTLVAADAAPCGCDNVVSPAKVSAFQACLASDGGAARLNLTVTRNCWTGPVTVVAVTS